MTPHGAAVLHARRCVLIDKKDNGHGEMANCETGRRIMATCGGSPCESALGRCSTAQFIRAKSTRSNRNGGGMKACPWCQASYPGNYTHCPRDGRELIDTGSWQDGTTIRGKYRILSVVGQGGMAVVYKAMHMRFDELRALKVMNPELAGDQLFVKRFMQEAVLTRKIQHPNAVRVDDIDEAEDGRPFIVMEYLEGQCLKDVIRAEAPMRPESVSLIIRQIAHALEAAHRLGVVHRDVKPANIILLSHDLQLRGTADREVAKVLDFGIAKARENMFSDSLAEHGTLTHTGNVIGTPAYMSPEQARGMRGTDLDGRSDLYSLGVVMYQMLAGGLPFKADTSMEWILAHLQTPPRPIREFRPDLELPKELVSTVMMCLEKDRACRPQTAAELIDYLERAEFGANHFSSFPAPQPTKGSRSSLSAAPKRMGDESFTRRSTGSDRGPSPLAKDRSARRPSRLSGIGIVGLVGAIVSILGAVAFMVWKPSPPLSVRATSSPPESQSQPSKPSTTDTHLTSAEGIGTAPEGVGQPSSPKDLTSATVAAQPVVDSNASSDSPSRNGRTPPVPGGSPIPRPQGFSTALARARIDENDGRFEDALRQYELASAIDPSDASVKRHIALLRERISKENDLIR